MQSDSFTADNFYRNDQIHKLTMPSAESWLVFQVHRVYHKNLGIHWRLEVREVRDSSPGHEHLTLERKTVCNDTMLHALERERFPKREMRTLKSFP